MIRLTRLLIAIAMAMLLFSCGDEPATTSSGESEYVLQYPDEAYAMALVEARTLRAPQELVEQIDRELGKIRREYGEGNPVVMQPFWKPWDTYRIWVTVDPSIKYGTDSVAVALFDSILTANSATVNSTYSVISSEEPWYPPEAVAMFAGLPGVSYVRTDATWVAEVYHSIVRLAAGEEVRYFFTSNNCGGLDVDYFQFEITRRRIRFVDVYKICPPVFDLPWEEQSEQWPPNSDQVFQAWSDSVLAVKQPWVDTAGAANQSLYIDHVVSWTRE